MARECPHGLKFGGCVVDKDGVQGEDRTSVDPQEVEKENLDTLEGMEMEGTVLHLRREDKYIPLESRKGFWSGWS